jgi:DNA repair protein RadA/Sms
MVLAVLESRCGVRFGSSDIYLNVAGGLRISEPAADLAVAAALVSSLSNSPLPANSVYFGEVSLSGAIRPVPQAPARLKEAERLGFAGAVMPASSKDGAAARSSTNRGIEHLSQLVASIAAGRRGPPPRVHAPEEDEALES